MKAAQLRQSILQSAVQGKLVPQDPRDEPASDLLARIRAEKAQLLKQGEIKKEKSLPPVEEDKPPFALAAPLLEAGTFIAPSESNFCAHKMYITLV